MPLSVDIVGTARLSADVEDALHNLLAFAFRFERPLLVSSALSVTMNFMSDEEISRLHHEFFQDPAPTDVITFPYDDVGDVSHLGDIAISVDTAGRNAVDIGHSCEREVAFLALHGLLHLLGYDDRELSERQRMLQRQTELLDQFESTLTVPW